MPPVRRSRAIKAKVSPKKRNTISMSEVPEECGICLEQFNAHDHVATQTKCHHFFGKPCLDTWIQSKRKIDATCPACRAALFDFPKPPTIVEEWQQHFGTTWLTPDATHFFIQSLWEVCLVLKHRPVIGGHELQYSIQKIHFDLMQKYDIRSILCEDDLEMIIELAKEMLKDMCENPGKTGLTSKERREVWIPVFRSLLDDILDPDYDFTAASDHSEYEDDETDFDEM